MTYSQLSEASLDLRAPGFSRVRKGGWWVRILTLFACDYICLSLAWLIAESYISFEDFICDPKEQEQYANFTKKENCYTIVGFDGYQALDRYIG